MYILVRLSTYDVQLLCSCLRPAGPRAPCWPACTLRARSAFESSAFVAVTRHTWSRTNKYYYIGSYRARQQQPPRRQQQSHWQHWQRPELDSYVVWATNLHLNAVARGRAPEIDRLYPPSRAYLDRQVQRLFCYGRECAVMTLKSLHKLKQLYFSHSAFKRSTIIEEHQN